MGVVAACHHEPAQQQQCTRRALVDGRECVCGCVERCSVLSDIRCASNTNHGTDAGAVLGVNPVVPCLVESLDLTEAQTHSIVGIRPMVTIPATHKMASTIYSRLMASEIGIGVVDGPEWALVGVSGPRTVHVMLALDGPRGRWSGPFPLSFWSSALPCKVDSRTRDQSLLRQYQITAAHRPRPGLRWDKVGQHMRSCGRILPWTFWSTR